MNKENNEDWKQTRIIHCPMIFCKGMLLENDLCHELKCSKCGNYFIEIIELQQTTKPKILEEK